MNKNNTSQPIRKILISNFGALGKVQLSLNTSVQIMIGPQASGKSTLGKTIYFCRKIRDYLSLYAREIWKNPAVIDPYTRFLKFLRNFFMGCFGTTKHMEPFLIQYFYDENNGKSVSIELDETKFVRFKFSDSLRIDITNLLKDAVGIANNRHGNLSQDFYAQRDYLDLFQKHAHDIFNDYETLLYIPAGRNLLATIPDLILPETPSNSDSGLIDISQLDMITQDFIHYIQRMRGRFGSKLDEITQNYLKTVKGEIRNQDVSLASELIRDVLKGDYVNDKDGEKLYYKNGKWIKLMFGSSGQQEVLWALNCIFLAILQNEKTFLIFEEPESHIFPDSQLVIAKLVALLINSTGSAVFITTHSPYILTAFNLLIYSGKVDKNNNIVDRPYRLAPSAVEAFLIPGNKEDFHHLIDQENKLINAIEIDHVSDVINEKMNALLIQEIQEEEKQNNDMPNNQ